MEIYAIPIENQFLIYRPLKKLAFVGNHALAELCLKLADGTYPHEAIHPQIFNFLDNVGFFAPDPPPPSLPDHAFKPTSAVLLMTNRCNLRCTYCYANAGVLSPVDLSLDLARTVIDTVATSASDRKYPYFELCFHGGGEPMQNWDVIQQATAYARTKSIPAKIVMVSNGVWSKAQCAWVLKNLDGVTISFDGRPATHDHQRILPNGGGSSALVLETIHALDEAKFSYGIRMTATAPWRDTLPADVRFICENTACKSLQVEPAFNTVRGTHQEASQDENLAFVEAFMEAFEIAILYGRELTYSGARPWLLTRSFCTAPYDALIVNAHRELVTCYEIASDAHTLAHISTIGTIDNAGSIALAQANRETLLNRLEDKQATHCAGCFAKYHCAGDCYTRSTKTDNGQLAISDARCGINRALTAQLLMWYVMAGGGVWHGETILTVPTSQLTGIY